MLLTRILGGSLAACGLIILGLSIAVWSADRERDKLRDQLSKANALIEFQNEAVAEMKAEGDRLRADVERARKAGEEGIAAARKERTRLSETPANGCPTPPEILEAYR